MNCKLCGGDLVRVDDYQVVAINVNDYFAQTSVTSLRCEDCSEDDSRELESMAIKVREYITNESPMIDRSIHIGGVCIVSIGDHVFWIRRRS